MVIFPHSPAIARAFDRLEANVPRFFSRFIKLAGPFWLHETGQTSRLVTAGLVGLTIAQVAIAILITEWSSALFNALDQHSSTKVWQQVGTAILILAANMLVTVLHLKLKRKLQLDWRQWLTDKLIGQWMDNGHQYQVIHMPGKHDNPDGRIAEDIRIATEYAIDLAHSLFYSLLLLIGFTKVLWGLSGTVYLPLGLVDLPIPGYLVWLALIYAGSASAIGFWIGKPLTKATDHRQSAEANFRFGLVRAREHAEGIALVQGETDERRRFKELFQGIVSAWEVQTEALSKIMLFTSGYSVLSMAFPVLVAAPRFISGAITLGALVQTTQSFQQMAAALSWPVDNLAKTAEWRASVQRVLGLTRALAELEEDIEHPDPNSILVDICEQPSFMLQNICIANPDGSVLIADLDANIQRGERVFLAGDSGLGDKLFKAMAGLWPWGKGKVSLPAGNGIFFMPARPYFPIESLRDTLSYPSPPGAFEDGELQHQLNLVQLPELADKLGEIKAWENSLSQEQVQRLGLARMFLHRPKWILLQEALDSLGEQGALEMMQLIIGQLPESGIITVSNQPAIAFLHQRHIDLKCPSYEMELKKEISKYRENDRRGQVPVPPLKLLIGTLRKDRRKSAS